MATFLQKVVNRNNIDGAGGIIVSTVNAIDSNEGGRGKIWGNAYWNGNAGQMVYGQIPHGNGLRSLSANLEVVGHEMFHGVTAKTSRLEYKNQSGAMNEAFSDIFGTIIANYKNSIVGSWNWLMGDGLGNNGGPFRSMAAPKAYQQPDNMKDYKALSPGDRPSNDNDWGNVHANSGIFNKAAYLIMTAKNGSNQELFTAKELALIFYVALTQKLRANSDFADGRRQILASTLSVTAKRSAEERALCVRAVANAFSTVGIN